MPQKNNTISFIIVNYKSEQELKRCLKDLSKINNANLFEVIIINNDTKSLSLSDNTFNKQIVHEVNQNIGYGRASNIGLSLATHDFVCFLNPDTHSFCDDFCEITKYIQNKKIIAAPQIRTQSNDIEPWSVGEDIKLTQIFKNHCGLNKKLWLNKKNTEVDWVSGAAMVAPRNFLQELGGFDEDFFLYYEDVDLCKRAKNAGGQIHYIPQYYLTHINGVSSKTNTKKQKQRYYKSQDLFFQKHCNSLQKNVLRICHLFSTK
jgi:GT2 family glycosyltransferase